MNMWVVHLLVLAVWGDLVAAWNWRINLIIDRFTRDLSGAMWILARLPEDGSAATSIHRCFQREVWHEVEFRERLTMCMACRWYHS